MIHEDTIKLLRECDAGVKMGVSSIGEVLDNVRGAEFRRCLRTCLEEHEKLQQEIQQLLAGHPEGQQGYEAFCATLLGQLEEAFEKPPRGLLPDTMCAVAQKLYLERTFRETEA